jgi:uncharacterized phage protein (TIGR01671 family)
MREIKFRAWVRDIMVDVTNVDFDDKYIMWFDNQYDRSLPPNKLYDTDSLENATLMQYTGLKDKNGKEIYEGDVVNVWGQSSNIASVGFLQGCFTLNWNDDSNTDLLGWYSFKRSVSSDPKDFEIIGNIYENPELLTP